MTPSASGLAEKDSAMPQDRIMPIESILRYLTLVAETTQVVTPSAGGPAEKGSVMPQDRILAIDGKPTEEVSLYEVGALLQGPKDSQVADARQQSQTLTSHLTVQGEFTGSASCSKSHVELLRYACSRSQHHSRAPVCAAAHGVLV